MQLKKLFSILFALLIGIVIIFFALKNGSTTSQGDALLAGDSWKKSLQIVPQANQLKTTTTIGGFIIGGDTENTETNLLAQRLLVEYVASQKGAATSTMSDATASNIAGLLAQEIKLPQQKSYSVKDLNISQDNSLAAGTTYKETLTALLKSHSLTEQQETELTILVEAINTKNDEDLKKLQAKVLNYEVLIKKLVSLKTPSSLAVPHLHLIQSYETLRSATVNFQKMLIDPVVGVAALAEYRSGIDALASTEQEYNNFNFENQ